MSEKGMMMSEEQSEYFNDRMLAQKLGVSRVTLKRWRSQGSGPPFYKLGARVVYEWSEVLEWLKEQRVGPSAA